MALQVVDGGMDAERNRCAEPADLNPWIFRSRRRTTWASFGGIARAYPLLMTAGQTELPERGSIGGQLTGNRALRRKAPAS
jgi:hypothetical protein